MPLVPPTPEHCNTPMQITRAELVCDRGCDSQTLSLPIDKQSLIENWPRAHGEYLSLVWHLKCSHCDFSMSQRFPHGRLPLAFIPGTYETRVFVGGNYDFMSKLRDIKTAVFELKSGFFPILPYDDFQLRRGEIHDWDLRLLHNCKYAIFDVTEPGGELMEIGRCAEYKTHALLVYDSRGPATEPPKARTMLLESGEHEHHSYGCFEDLKAVVEEFLLQKDPKGFRRARQVMGYHFASYVVREKIYLDGTAEHEYSYLGLEVDVPDFGLTQLTHEFRFTSGEFTSFKPQLGSRETWKEDGRRCSERAKVGVITFAPPLHMNDKPIDYSFKAKTKGSYMLWKHEFNNLPQDQRDDPLLAAGYEFSSRHLPWSIDTFSLSVEFPKGYLVEPEPRAYCGAELNNEAIRVPPDEFKFIDNVATLRVSKPMFNFLYCIVWKVPEST